MRQYGADGNGGGSMLMERSATHRIRRMKAGGAGIAILAAAISAAARGGGGGRARRGDLHEGHRADPAAELPELPPPELHGADVADDLRRGPPLGAQHQAADQRGERRRQDAALVHRQDHRHTGLQGRRFPEHGGDRDDRPLGGCRRAARQSGRPAAAADVRRRRRVGHRRAGPDRDHAGRHHGGGGARLVGRAGAGAARQWTRTATSRRCR